ILQLRCFLAVVEAGSVALAARRLGMASPSVSRAITRLEKEAGVKLLHRSTHALSLTEEGEALLDSAQGAVSAARRFRDVAAGKADVTGAGVVHISAPVAFARQVLCPLLPEFARLHPEVRLDLRMTNEIADLPCSPHAARGTGSPRRPRSDRLSKHPHWTGAELALPVACRRNQRPLSHRSQVRLR